MNAGKKFEEDFKKSVPECVFYYRFKDGTASWNKSDKVRFQAHNICDCLIFNNVKLFLLELKSHKGKSLPFSCIRDKQLEELFQANKFGNIQAGLVINFRDLEETYFIDIDKVMNFIHHSDRKSIPVEFLKAEGKFLPQFKKRTRYTYDLIDFLEVKNVLSR